MPDQINLMDLDRPSLEMFFLDMGERGFRARQLMQWIYQRGVVTFDQMTDLSFSLRDQLSKIAVVSLPEVMSAQIAVDGTRKWLLRLDDGNAIETVFIPEKGRGTLCISSQVGCALNCTFCATARQGFNRNLTTAEIIGQVWVVHQLLSSPDQRSRSITNIVLMGMGEPLLNYENVVPAMQLMLDDLSFGLSRRRVTLSTAGVVPGIERLNDDMPVSLAVSLHAANNALRDRLVPLNKKYPLEVLMPACRRYVSDESRRRVTFEYTMLAGINDSDQHAKELIKLLHHMPGKVNLIPFNSFPGSKLKSSNNIAINKFRDRLMAANIMTMTRRTRGEDIDAACGQLAGKIKDLTRRSGRIERKEESLH